jgi:RimJ/RimL family protein N-acetyltransferase
MQDIKMPILKTERLLLRPLEIGDVELLWPDISDAEISRLMAWDAQTDKEQTRKFLEAEVARRESNRGVTWAIFKNDAFCGIVSLIGVIRHHRSLTYNKAELAYWMGRRFQRQGITTEACQAVLQFAFKDLGLHKIVVGHFDANTASENLIKRLGFRYIGVQVEEFMKGGVWHDHKSYELLARDFRTAPSRKI